LFPVMTNGWRALVCSRTALVKASTHSLVSLLVPSVEARRMIRMESFSSILKGSPDI
jgi:hypothetical protein